MNTKTADTAAREEHEARMKTLADALGLNALREIVARIGKPAEIAAAHDIDPTLATIPAGRWELYHMDARLLFNAARNEGRLPSDRHLAITESVLLLKFVALRHHANIAPDPSR